MMRGDQMRYYYTSSENPTEHYNQLALEVCFDLCIVTYLVQKYILFFSLALSDLLVGAVVMPLALINDLSAHGWRFGQDFCKIWIASDVMCSTASILNLMAISFDRYLFSLQCDQK